ncbi:scavenger receptor class B member 1 isoform X2 [Varanus komodoensis]|uniref:scavenger receptor class B member 1 isoform X2 n=1 Tax=Varanus komodoensis TaxID=61221 RepID=UPI001CF7CE81|nr:scavenger receptor class B member 1 isoform X2 [Varanus komodoensis]
MPFPFSMSIYLFEVMNSKQVLLGAKPVLNQRGPYVYRETRQKENVTFYDNGTVSFLEYRRFYFLPDQSNGSESDYIVIPNPIVMGASLMLENMPFGVKLSFTSALALFGQKAFMNRTVGQILWGYDDPLLEFLNTIKPGMLPFKGKFGLFSELNGTSTGLFTVYTGMDDISKIHMVDSWNGLKKLSYWRSDQCNMINGTAGEIWPPFMTPSTPVEFYSPDACRSMTLEYVQSGQFKGIPTFRYTGQKTLFSNGTDYPPNEGFCPCRQSGLLNVSSCRYNVSLFLSQPHFLNADPALLDTVVGLHPSEEQHGFYLDVHPLTGVPLSCAIRMQLSLFMKQVNGILQTGSIKPIVFPILWFSEGAEIEGDVVSEFYNNLVLLPALLEYAQYFLVGLGGILLIIAAILGLKSKNLTLARQRKGSAVTQTLSASKFYNPGSGTVYSYQGPKRDARAASPQTPDLQDGASDTSPLLQADSGTVRYDDTSAT